jgi:hypothetical protein
MTGSAYRTTAVPHTDTADFDGDCAIYAVYPSAIYAHGVTNYVMVQASPLANDSGVYPCDSTGLLLSWELLGCMVGTDHSRVLRVAGWELEEVRHVA